MKKEIQTVFTPVLCPRAVLPPPRVPEESGGDIAGVLAFIMAAAERSREQPNISEPLSVT